MPEVVKDFQRNRARIEDKIRRKRILGFLEANGMLEHIRALEAELAEANVWKRRWEEMDPDLQEANERAEKAEAELDDLRLLYAAAKPLAEDRIKWRAEYDKMQERNQKLEARAKKAEAAAKPA